VPDYLQIRSPKVIGKKDNSQVLAGVWLLALTQHLTLDFIRSAPLRDPDMLAQVR